MTDVTNEQARTVRDMIEPAIMKAGGWVNTHAHADRAFTLSPEILKCAVPARCSRSGTHLIV